MTTLQKAIHLYEKEGFGVKIGLNPFRFNNYRDAPSTIVFREDRRSLPPGGDGIAIGEIYFFEALLNEFKPKNIFGIGNGYGWSTILFSLICPYSVVRVLDCGFPDAEKPEIGIDLTNQIATNNHLDVKVLKGLSPEDVSQIVHTHFPTEKIDLVFIDGGHTNDQIVKDFKSIETFLSKQAIVVFHDVLNFEMLKGIEEIAAWDSAAFKILHRTESGMVALYKNATPEIETILDLFSEKDWVLDEITRRSSHLKAIQQMVPPILFRWTVKNINKAKRVFKKR